MEVKGNMIELKGRSLIARCLLAVLLAFSFMFICASVTAPARQITVYAAEDLGDNLGTSEENSEGMMGGSVTEDDQEVGNWISNQRGMTGEQLNEASENLSFVTNFIGYVVGGIVILIFAGLFLITALDLLYITFPPVRNLLYKAGTDGTGAYTGGGMAGGYGRGMMGMGMAGAGGAAGGTNKPTQWVSDEAVQCAALMGGSAQAANGAGGMYGGGMYGGMQGQAQQQQSTKSVIGTYFRKRIFFMILLVLCVIILTSSALLGTGVNLALWGVRLIDMLNGYIPA